MISAFTFLRLIVNLAKNQLSIGEKHDSVRRLNMENLDVDFLLLTIDEWLYCYSLG